MSEFKIVQIKCPNCTGELNSVGEFSKTKKCPYCFKEFQVTGTMDKETQTPERIVVFNTKSENFESAILNMFAEEDYAPDDVFDIAAFKDVEGIYLPMYLYEGKFENTWSCSVGYYENEVRASSDGKAVKNVQVLKWRPQSGVTRGNYAVVCSAYEGKEIKPELIEYARMLHFDPVLARPFDEKNLEGYNFMTNNLDKETTWYKYGNDSVQSYSKNLALQQVPGERYKDFMGSAACDQKHDGRLVFLPFWMVYYEYNGEHHYAIMEGSGQSSLTGTVPIDQARVNEVNKLKKIIKFVFWGAIALSVIIVFIPALGLTSGLIGVGLSFVARFITKMVIDSKVKTIINKSKAIRRSKLEQILQENQ